MRKKSIIMLVSLVLILLVSIPVSFADNPVIQTLYTADPFPMVYNEVCYLYTDHDEDTTVNNFYTMNDWKCYTSTDMVNWTDRGTILSYKNISWAQGDAWAGQVIPRNGKFYMYFPVTRLNGGGARVIGVAVANSPLGPFSDPLGKPLITNNGAQDIDPSVFIDDNGQAYLYWGNGNLYYVKLNQDMISYSGSVVTVNPKPSGYVEGPWFYKRNSLYYMVYAGMGSGSENIQYATSSSPTGPWTSKGVIQPTQGNSYTNHPAVCDFAGNSYFFYHNGALPGGGSYKRSVCVEKFNYNADGTIPTIPWTTTGPPQVGALNPYSQIEAETICWESGVETETCSEGGMDVCNIENGDYIKVKGVDFGTGATSFEARVASATSGGNIELRLDSSTGTLVGTCAVSGTGGWQTWVTKSCNVSGASGKHDLYLRFTGGSGSLFNINWWKFSGGPTPTPGPTSTPTPTTIPGTISIAAGSTSAVGSFQADQYYSGGSTYSNTNTIDVSQITSNQPPAALFNNERYGAMSYTIPGFNAGSSYSVTLYFAETYLTSSGSRRFSVSINGATVLSNFDIYASAGGQNKAIAQSFTATANSSGQIVIQFTAGTENPKINGISVQPGGNTPTPTVTPTPTRVGPTPTPTATVTPTPTGSISIYIAAGRTSAVGSFQADQYYSGGSTYSNTNTVDVSQITSNPPPAALFNNERYGAMSYTIPGFTAGSSYTVTLYFAETYLTASGRRLFNVSINGSTVLSSFDIYASAGGQNKAIARSFTATANSSGQIVIQFISGTENPKINGISIK